MLNAVRRSREAGVRRRTVYGAVVVAAVAASAVSAVAHREPTQANDFIILFPVELAAVFLGGGAAVLALAGRQDRAPGALAAGLYLLVVGAAVGAAFPIWLPEDDTILGSALLAGALAGMGTAVTVGGAAAAAGAARPASVALAAAGGVLAFLTVAAGGMAAPLARLHLPLAVPALVALGAAPTLWRGRRRLARPLAVAAVGAVGTVAALLARGPGDWAAASTSAKLYSFPIVLLAGAISLIIMDSDQPAPPAPAAT